jgi:hypothetical protein
LLGRKLADVSFDAIDDVVRGGRTGGDPNAIRRREPFGAKICVRLDVMHIRAMAAAGLHQLPRVVAVRPADYDDDVSASRELDGSALALLCRAANGVDETDLGSLEVPPNQADQMSHPLERLGCLGGDPNPRMFVESFNIAFVEHDIEHIEISGQSPHLHVGALTDDDGVIAVAHERSNGPMRDVHQRAGRFDDLETEGAGLSQCPL